MTVSPLETLFFHVLRVPLHLVFGRCQLHPNHVQEDPGSALPQEFEPLPQVTDERSLISLE